MQNKSNNTIQAFWVGMGSLSAFTLSIISAAILSRYFDKAEYGTYRQILYVYSTLLVVFSGRGAVLVLLKGRISSGRYPKYCLLQDLYSQFFYFPSPALFQIF
ncbi:MAG: hypothetical protein BWY47_01325 [Bacteroidetes bacterium ADurb.Bin302]|nr:MAG: hypothetical protein BWY47_01325 [Bacteroidetes bacterium ADurb.Bin302]